MGEVEPHAGDPPTGGRASRADTATDTGARPRPTPRPRNERRPGGGDDFVNDLAQVFGERGRGGAPVAPRPGLDEDLLGADAPPAPAPDVPDVVLPQAATLLCDGTGVVLRANPALRRLAGSADPTGMKLAQLLVGPDSDARLVRADRRLARVRVVRWPQPGDRTAVVLVPFPEATAPADEAPALDRERAPRSGTWTFDLAAGTLTRSEGLVELYRAIGVRPDGPDGPVEGEQVERACRILRRGPDASRAADVDGGHAAEIRTGGRAVLSCRTRVERTPGGGPLRLIGTVQDVTDRRRADQRAQRSGQRFADLVSAITDGVAMVDERGRIVDANPALCALLDADLEQLRGVPARSLCADPQRTDSDLPDWLSAPAPDAGCRRIDSLPLVRADGAAVHCEVVVHPSTADDGRPFWLLLVSDTEASGAAPASPGDDVTLRTAAAPDAPDASRADPLTGLPNRAAAFELADRLLAGPAGARVALVCGDIDDFARVNISLGHEAGDALLVELAARLRRELPPGCTPARLSGDEFAVVCADHGEVGGPAGLAGRVADLLRGTVTVQGRPVATTASVGLATRDSGPSGAVVRGADLLRWAEVAMTGAKRHGRSAVRLADRSTVGPADRQLALEAELRAAIENDELRLEYQPVVGPDGTVLSAEALLRWSHPVHGEVSPGEFLPVAARGGLQRDLDRWVLRTAAREAASWPRLGQRISVAVNLAGLLPGEPDFLEEVTAAVTGSGLAWDQLTLELVETSLVSLPQAAKEAMDELVRRGVRFAVDDFGTGYSSLSRLKELPAQTVKVDRAFVVGVGTDPADFALARAVVEVARAMGRATVAEGVETAEQFHVLRGLGVNAFQGWLFARSLRPDELQRVLRGGGLPTPGGPAAASGW